VRSGLQAEGVEVVDISPLHVRGGAWRHRAFRAARRAGLSYRYELDGPCLRSFARQVEQRIRSERVDAIIAMGVVPTARWVGDVPLATWSDATIENLALYREYQRLPSWQARNARAAEAHAAQRAAVLAYASEWASQSAIQAFGADPASTVIAPFGANLVPEATWSMERTLAHRSGLPWRLIWIGTDWRRKRGDFAVAVAEELIAAGADVRLTLVGAGPPDGTVLPPWTQHLGFVDASSPDGRTTLSSAIARSHLLLLPSRVEGFGIAVAEGNAHAVPCLGSGVGGLASAIQDGVNGFLFEPDAPPRAYAMVIEKTLRDSVGYRRIATTSRTEYESRLNWRSSCRRILDRLGAA
jgi:glycosyltransferase involved in cell wall biosynthesis